MDKSYNVTAHDDMTRYDYEDLIIYVISDLFGVPLYGWWVLTLETYEPGDIQGTLMEQVFSFEGPHETRADAEEAVVSWLNGSPMNGQQG